MRIQKKNRNDEKRILIGMIVDDVFLGRISEIWKSELFKSTWGNLISKWCFDYYKKYQKSPKDEIETIFLNWSAKQEDDSSVRIIEKFLNLLSGEYELQSEKSNTAYLTDIATTYFTKVKLENLVVEINDNLERNTVDIANQKVIDFTKIEISNNHGVDVFNDDKIWQEAFDSNRQSLITFNKALGKFFGDSFERDGFIAFLGPSKRGKTQILLDLAYRSALQRNKTVFFSIGDMSQSQVLRRLATRITRTPIRTRDYSYPISLHQLGNEWQTELETKENKDGLDWRDVLSAVKKLQSRKLKTEETLFRLSCHPSNSLSVKGIRNIIKTWEIDDWTPDVIVVDYADVLGGENNRFEKRDQVNETWKSLRALSQEYHCLVVTATQADTPGGISEVLTRTNFSEDRRKLDHVTGMIGINQTSEEKEYKIMRLNWIVRREDDFNERYCVKVAGCPEICNPFIISAE